MGSVDNQEVTSVACCDPSCRDATTIDLIKMVFPNNLIGLLSITAKWCTGSQSCMTVQANQNRRRLFIKWQNLPKIENSWELMSEIQDSENFSPCGIGGAETYGAAAGINYLMDSTRRIGTYHPSGHCRATSITCHTTSITPSSFFMIWYRGGSLFQQYCIGFLHHHLEDRVILLVGEYC